MGVVEKLQKALDNKEDIKSALMNRRAKVISDNMSTYAQEILAIEPLLDTLEINDNGNFNVKDYKNVNVGIVAQGDEVLIDLIEGDMTELNVPYGTTKLKNYAFYYMENLKNISLPSTITTIGKQAFAYCSLLESVEIPDSVTKLEQGTFSACKNLVNVKLSNKITNLPFGTFQSCLLLESVEIPDSVTEISGGTFSYCKALKNITLPSGVKTIGSNAFEKCQAITKMEIPSGVTIIDSNTFKDCINLTEVLLPEGITYILNSAFQNCTSLTYLEIPQSVTSISGYALKIGSSTNKAIIVMKGTTPPTLYAYAIDKNSTDKIFVEKGCRETYIITTNWSTLADIIVERNSVIVSVPSALLNNENYTYSLDNGETYNQFTSTTLALNDVATIKMKSTTADTTILIGTTAGGNDVGTIANSELTFSFSGDTTIYLTIQ